MEKDPNFKEEGLKRHGILSSTGFYIKSSVREVRRRKLYFCLALISTLLVVAATAVSQTILHYAPLIFLQSSESKSGAIDLSVTPIGVGFTEYDGVDTEYVYKNLLLNTSRINSQVDQIYPGVTAPRFSTGCRLRLTQNQDPSCRSTTNPPYTNCPYFSTTFVIQDTGRETSIGMGVDLGLPNKIPEGGIIITGKLASYLGLKAGDSLVVQVDVTQILREVVIQYNFEQTLASRRINDNQLYNSIAYLPVFVYQVVSSLDGKFSDDSADDMVLSEYQYFFKQIVSHRPTNYANTHSNANYLRLITFLATQNPQNYANIVSFNIPDRLKVYTNSNFDEVQDTIIHFAGKVTDAIGIYPFMAKLPVFEELSNLKYGAVFLGIALNIIIVVLFVLSTILIYNLLLVTVETKTLEFGIIRMLGLTKFGVAQLILVQALMFVLPGVVLGLAVAMPLLLVLGNFLNNTLKTDISIVPTGTALFWSIFLGILIPIISSYYPMKSALGKGLGLALDVAHSKTSAIQINIEISSKRLPWTYITFGLLSVVFGVAIYIILPLSLLSFNAGLLLGLFFFILLGLLLGLTLLSLNFQHLMEKLMTHVFLCWTSAPFRGLILKNLVAHKMRNRQTAIMYSLALGFVIFIVVALNQILNNLAYQVLSKKGALLEISGKDSTLLDYHADMQDLLDNQLADVVESYTWVTADLRQYLVDRGYQDVIITHRGRLYDIQPKIRGVSAAAFSTTINTYLDIAEQDKSTGLTLSEQLYTPRGSQGMLIGHSYKKQLGLELDIDTSIIVSCEDGTATRTEELRALAFLNNAPGFLFSNIPSVTNQDVLVSLPTYMRLVGDRVTNFEGIPMQILLVKVKGDSDSGRSLVVDQMNRLASDNAYQMSVWDYRDTEKNLESNKSTLSLVFKFVEVLVMILTMFSLITSMTTNIMEQTKEIAVLRAVGLTKFKVNMLYVSEAFILVMASAFFGIIIGTIVAWTLSIQQVLFTQLPLVFHFPYSDLIIIFIAAVLSAFVSAYFPARRTTRWQISKIIRL